MPRGTRFGTTSGGRLATPLLAVPSPACLGPPRTPVPRSSNRTGGRFPPEAAAIEFRPLDMAGPRVHHDRIDTSGTVTLRHSSRLHHIGLGRLLAGTRITLLVHDLHS